MVLLSYACAVRAASVSEGRAAMAQGEEEMKAAQAAYAQNDPRACAEHQKKATAHFAKAKEIFEACGAARSKDAKDLADYAAALMRTGDADLAAEALQRAADLAPADAAVWRALGRALVGLGEPRAADAVRALRKALERDAASADAALTHVHLGRAYRLLRLHDLARESFAKAVELDPGCIPGKIGLAGSDFGLGRVKEASDAVDALGMVPMDAAQELTDALAYGVRRFEESRRWFADTAENHMAYAKILFRVGRAADALAASERAARLDPDDYATWNFVGDLSYQMGDRARARKAYNKSLELKPDQPRTAERLDALDKPPEPGPAPK